MKATHAPALPRNESLISVGLEIGTTKFCAAVGEVIPDGTLNIRGIPHIVTNQKSRFRPRRVLPEIGAMDLHPEALRTLPGGDNVGFGEMAQVRKSRRDLIATLSRNRGKLLSPSIALHIGTK